jgi:hypothetical protein
VRVNVPPHWHRDAEYAISTDGMKMFGVLDLENLLEAEGR